MNFELFASLYQEAKECADIERYISERGWQEWMDRYTPKDNDITKVSEILKSIYSLSNMSIREMRETSGLTRAEFARIYGIPNTTIQDWEYGNNRIADYTLQLIAYTFFTKDLERITYGDAQK